MPAWCLNMLIYWEDIVHTMNLTFTSRRKSAGIAVVLWEWPVFFLSAGWRHNIQIISSLFQDFAFWLNFKRLLDQLLCVCPFKFCPVLFLSAGRYLNIERYVGLSSYWTGEKGELNWFGQCHHTEQAPRMSLEFMCLSKQLLESLNNKSPTIKPPFWSGW